MAATVIVDTDDKIQITARVASLDELFEAPAFDPFRDQLRTTAVVDEIVAHLRARRLQSEPEVSLTLLLPAEQNRPDAAAVANAALQRYVAFKVEETRQALVISRFEGRARLPWGVIVAVSVLALVLLLNLFLPENLKPVLVVVSPFVTVVIWVAIWNPAETLLYENWGLRREESAYLTLGKASITVQTA